MENKITLHNNRVSWGNLGEEGACRGRGREYGVRKGIRKHGRRPESAEIEVLQAKFQ